MKQHTLKRSTGATLKSVGDEGSLGDGRFSALVSVFGNVDSLGEVVMPGAFTETLSKWKASGDPIPVVWSHDWRNPMSHIGEVLEAKETDMGLEVTAQLDMTNPTAVQVFKLLKDRRVKEFSYSGVESDFNVVAGPDGDPIYQVGKVDLIELGPCMKGANPATVLLSTKADQVEVDAETVEDADPQTEYGAGDDGGRTDDVLEPDEGLRELVRQTVLQELASRSEPQGEEEEGQDGADDIAKSWTVPETTAWAAETEINLMEGTL
ncbi:HK97 family phage prohead protease [Bifidobacterium xylocopae]|uniref:HK97 family phage prohead protease n=1 Tax=Bifidobacterium xylocopae TaxID=2493119 RepID=A0A366KFM7_9BIFI|nr:HK97 family phage prohead protease [Bifidobacterium xylocopae]RBQ00063.1 HK97 family phage prohead protease [Bifidobacterium xylocopae]